MSIPATIPGRLICDTQDVSEPGEFQFLDHNWNVTRGRLSAWRVELACPRCGRAVERQLAAAGDRHGAADTLRWDGTVPAPTIYGRLRFAPHGSCAGWSGHLEGGEFRTDPALLRKGVGDE
ncbi:hypothetical protein [Maricaulis maris]|uniref:Uncharacterized protein n=1 Tax=Maricaulis maris TaxID=74318 RepID=A0A495D1M8_9PROT|nr:hypothetical protein [Maricaulis maris]RKQ95438.1 hypothetical protein C7435_2540 [Maricaulis maris]